MEDIGGVENDNYDDGDRVGINIVISAVRNKPDKVSGTPTAADGYP